jgi:hypothetical protein
MTCKEQNRYLFIRELIHSSFYREATAGFFYTYTGFIIETLICGTLYIDFLFPQDLISQNIFVLLVILAIIDLPIIIGGIAFIIIKTNKYSLLKKELNTIAKISGFENYNLVANPLLKKFFE